MIPEQILKSSKSNRPSVMIAVPTANITGYMAGRLFDFLHAAKASLNYEVDIIRIEQNPVDVARNFIADFFLKSGMDWLLMVDDDTIPPMIALDMINHNKPFCAGITYIYRNGDLVLNAFKKEENKPGYIPVANIEFTGLHSLDAVGTACVLIHKSVFSKISKPYFSTELVADKSGKTKGEDLYFCDKLKEAGIPVMIDSNVICGHMKTVDLASMALRHKRTVDEYEKKLKEYQLNAKS